MKFLKWMGMAGVLGFVLSVSTPIWNYLARPMLVEPSIQSSDAIVVLGAGVLADQTLSDESLRRVVYGLRLFNRGLAPLLVLSGPRHRTAPGLSEAEIRRDLAIQWGIPAGQILVISDVKTTHEESMKIAAALTERGLSRALLVTSALHMRRAKAVFEKAGVAVHAAPSDNYPEAAVAPQERLLLMLWVLQQGLALLHYRVAGYI